MKLPVAVILPFVRSVTAGAQFAPPLYDTVAAGDRFPPPLHDPVAAATALVSRALGPAFVASFSFFVIPFDAATGNDVFELGASASPVVISGSTGVALASGVGWYLKYTLNASWGWGFNNSGNNIQNMLPAPTALPAPAAPGRFVSPAKFRYSWCVNITIPRKPNQTLRSSCVTRPSFPFPPFF
jgi:hypothetical protein